MLTVRDIAAGFALKAAARVHPVEIAIGVELEQGGGMVGRPSSGSRIDAVEPKSGQIQCTSANLASDGSM